MSDEDVEHKDKYKYTRFIALCCMFFLLAFNMFVIVTIFIKPDIAEKYELVILAIIVPLATIIGHYMGVSNKWGIK